MGKKTKKNNKLKEKMNRRNELNILALNLQQFQEITENYYNSFTSKSFENMIGRSCMPTHLFQNIQNTQLHKQEDENSSGSSSSSKNKQQENSN